MVALVVVGVVVAGLVLVAWRDDVARAGHSVHVLGAAAGVVLVAFLWWAAETPLGRGDGVVPKLEGRTSCDGEVALEKRGLRWRYDGPRANGAVQTEASGDWDFEPSCDVDVVLEQRPAPGTELGERGVVRVVTSCSVQGCE